MEFRKLNANEIDARIGQIGAKSVTLLLYKNARVDMQLLDETVGAENWQREHYECKGNLFCRVGIYNKELKEWVWKADCGTESYTEKEKGEASDSFKRACVCFGIGRELYTAPRIYIPNDVAGVKDGKCYTRFKVNEVGYDKEGNINKLTISKLGWNDEEEVVYNYGNTKVEKSLKKEVRENSKTRIENKKKTFANMCGKSVADVEGALAGKVLKNDEEIENMLDSWIRQKGGAPVEYKRT